MFRPQDVQGPAVQLQIYQPVSLHLCHQGLSRQEPHERKLQCLLREVHSAQARAP